MDEVNLDTIIEQFRSTNNYTKGIRELILQVPTPSRLGPYPIYFQNL